MSEIADAVKRSGLTFDVIGFDACLMQDIEIAKAFEPCADYFLASEEVEGGYGWYYTAGFSELARDPGLSSEDFGRLMVSGYDVFNTALNDGTPNTQSTMSFVDLTRVGPAAEKLNAFYENAHTAILEDSGDYAEIALAASNTFAFSGDIQIDLIDFLEKLGDTDIDDSICTSAEREELIRSLKAAIVCRNANSSEEANGLAFAFPYKSIYSYSDEEKELRALSEETQRSFMNDVFSIIAVQQMKAQETTDTGFIQQLVARDFTEEDWYVEGFEDYDSTKMLVDIPLTETDDETKPVLGHVTGFDHIDNTLAFMEKGSEKLQAGDRLEFLFDCYDEQGGFVRTETYGKTVTVKTMEKLVAADTTLPPGSYSFLGRLTDVYQRDMLTETVEWQIGE